MSVARILPIILNNGEQVSATLTNDHHNDTNENIYYKFYVPRTVAIVSTRITVKTPCPKCPNVRFNVQANAMPSENSHIYSTIINPKTNKIAEDSKSFDFYVYPGTWHYIDLKFEVDQNRTEDEGNEFMQRDEEDELKGSQLIQKVQDFELDNNVTWHVELEFQLNFHPEEEREKSDSEHSSYMFRNIEFYPLLRQTYREFFMFDYDLVPDVNGTVPTLLNLTGGVPSGFRFEVGDVYDIGGTLSFALSMKHDIKGSDMKGVPEKITSHRNDDDGVIAERLIDSRSEDEEIDKLPRSNQTIIVCMKMGEPGVPKWPDKCQYGDKVLPASSIINNTDAETSTGLIHVPFPESGQWYVTMALFCHGAESTARVTIIDSVKEFIRKYSQLLDAMTISCSCFRLSSYYKRCIEDRKCLSQLNETETLKVKECMMDSKCTPDFIEMTKKFELHHKFATEQTFVTEGCNASVIFTISSSPCVAGRCGRYGRCYHYMSGGFVFSTCLCIKGYRGWDCTEDSQVPSSVSILVASLLLTLSNLLFIPSIYIAIKRKYHTESVIYFFVMFFSTFYHACDSGEDEYSFCLVKISVLQFCDFYCGLLAIWVTLVAMSNIRQKFVSILHMFGAIMLAFATELNKQSLWAFLAPALTGICIISTSWGMRCRKTRKIFPSRNYWAVYMPIGTVLVMIGLLCYGFLQTKMNYYIVHSAWHMLMALSILCLLPNPNSFLPKS